MFRLVLPSWPRVCRYMHACRSALHSQQTALKVFRTACIVSGICFSCSIIIHTKRPLYSRCTHLNLGSNPSTRMHCVSCSEMGWCTAKSACSNIEHLHNANFQFLTCPINSFPLNQFIGMVIYYSKYATIIFVNTTTIGRNTSLSPKQL